MADGGFIYYLRRWFCQFVQDEGLGICSLLVTREVMIARHATRFLVQLDSLWCRVMWAQYGA